MNFYNEYEKYPAQWLRNLSEAREIPTGKVDERDIRTIKPAELTGFTQCHFFAGLGGWPYALRLAGWPENRPVWTGSCPCQPFSVAGKGKGVSDDRHLWPAFRWLIAQCRPATIFGEQVASKDGRIWLAGARADLEALGYAVGCADLSAAGVGAPHIRQRLWWVAHAKVSGPQAGGQPEQNIDGDVGFGDGGRVGNATGNEQRGNSLSRKDGERITVRGSGGSGRMGQSDSTGPQSGEQGAEASGHRSAVEPAGGDGGVAKPLCKRRRGGREENRGLGEIPETQAEGFCGDGGVAHTGHIRQTERQEQTAGSEQYSPWGDFYLIPCADGKARRVKSGISPLAHGIPQRVGALKAYGNAIVPQVAAVFIKSFMEAGKF